MHARSLGLLSNQIERKQEMRAPNPNKIRAIQEKNNAFKWRLQDKVANSVDPETLRKMRELAGFTYVSK